MAGGSRIFGLGVLVSAKDEGSKRAVKGIREETDSLSDSVKEAGDNTAGLGSRWNTFIGGLQLHRLNQIAGALSGMAQQAGTALPGIMSGEAFQATSIESAGVAFANTYRNMTAGLGEYEKIVAKSKKQVAGLAYSLDVSADAMLDANIVVARAGKELKEYGVSQKALAGLIKSGMTDGKQLGGLLVSLSDGYGLGAEGARKLVDQITAIGESVGQGKEFLGAMPGLMSEIDKVAARYPDIAANVGDYAASIAQLGAAYTATGLSTEESTQKSLAVFNQLMASRGNLTDLFTGMGSDFDSLAKELAISSGDVNGAMDMVMQKPYEFAKALFNMEQQGGQNAVVAARMKKTLAGISPEFGFLIQGGEATAQAFAKIDEAGKNADGTLERIGKRAAKTSRTLQESMSRQQDAFQTRLNSMSRAAVGGSGSILKQQQASYQKVTGFIEEFAGDKGPLGMLTRGFLRSRAGLFGFTSTLDAIGGPILDMAANMAPLVTTLAALGGPVSAGLGTFNGVLGGLPGKLLKFAGPVAIVAGAGYLLYKNWDKVGEVFQTAVDWMVNASGYLAGLAPKITEWVDSIDWVQMGQDFVDGIMGIIDSIAGGIDSNSPAASVMIDNLGTFFGAVLDAVPKMVGGIASGIWGRIFGESIGGGGNPLEGAFDTLLKVTNFGNLADAISSGNLGDAIFEGLFTSLNIAMLGVPGALRTMFEDLGVGDILGDLKAEISPVFDDITGFFTDTFGGMWDQLKGFYDKAKPLFERFGAVFKKILVALGPVAKSVFGGIGAMIGWLWDNVAKPVFTTIGKVWSAVFGVVSKVFLTVMDAVVSNMENAELRWKYMVFVIRKTAKWIGLSIKAFFVNPFLKAQNSVATIVDLFQEGFSSINVVVLKMKAGIAGFLASIMENIPGFADTAGKLKATQKEALQEIGQVEAASRRRSAIADAEKKKRLDQIAASEAERVQIQNDLAQAAVDLASQEKKNDAERKRRAAKPHVVSADKAMAAATATPGVAPMPAESTAQKQEAAAAMGRREAARAEAISKREKEKDKRMMEAVIQSFGAQAVEQLSTALTIRLPRGSAGGSMPGR